MAHIDSGGAMDAAPEPARDGAPPTNSTLMVLAGVCLIIPIVALMWVSSYAKEDPKLGGIPFFFWYQFLWVFITAALTYTAHRLVLAARGERNGTGGRAGAGNGAGRHAGPREDES